MTAALGGVPRFDVVGEPEPAETPIVRLFYQWETIQKAQDAVCDAAQDRHFEVVDAICAAFDPERGRIQDAISAEPVTNLRDLAVKVIVGSRNGCFGLDDVLTLECARLAGRDFDKLPRCLFGDLRGRSVQPAEK